MNSDVWEVAIVAAVGVAPLAIVLIICILRGYSIHLSLTRENRSRRD